MFLPYVFSPGPLPHTHTCAQTVDHSLTLPYMLAALWLCSCEYSTWVSFALLHVSTWNVHLRPSSKVSSSGKPSWPPQGELPVTFAFGWRLAHAAHKALTSLLKQRMVGLPASALLHLTPQNSEGGYSFLPSEGLTLTPLGSSGWLNVWTDVRGDNEKNLPVGK